MTSTITRRATKGSALTHAELDANFADLLKLANVSGADLPGTLLVDAAPNVSVADTGASIGTTLSQVAVGTIPGGRMGARTRLQVGAIFDLGGNDSKDIRFLAGPASGSFATAAQFGGLAGLTTQRWAPLHGLIFSDNSVTAQRANAVGQGDWDRANAAVASVALTIDTDLDWNVYVGVKFNASNNGNTAILRNWWVKVIG